MTIGTVDSSGEARVPLTVAGPGPEEPRRDIAALLDTGFNGVLALPPALIDELDLEQNSREQYMTAGGAMHFTGVYESEEMSRLLPTTVGTEWRTCPAHFREPLRRKEGLIVLEWLSTSQCVFQMPHRLALSGRKSSRICSTTIILMVPAKHSFSERLASGEDDGNSLLKH